MDLDVATRSGLAVDGHAEAHQPTPTTLSVFVTVGTELPFDRLVRAIDDWAADRDGEVEVFAQVGESTYVPHTIAWKHFVDGEDFDAHFGGADLIVAHAGMGTILTALERGLRLIVMPRRAALGEHRNDHQVATANRLLELGQVDVAFDEVELIRRLDESDAQRRRPIGSRASDSLIDALSTFINA